MNTKNITLGVLALFSAFSLLRFTGITLTPFVPNDTTGNKNTMEMKLAKAPPCNRFSSPESNGGLMISNAEFTTATAMYQNSNPIDVRTQRAFVTKRAIDYMLGSNCAANGLNCYFGLKATPRGNKLILMLTAATSSTTSFDQTTNPGSVVFESDILCPDECGSGDTTLTVQWKANTLSVHQ